MNNSNMDKLFSQIAQYTLMQKEISDTLDSMKDQVKEFMTRCNVDTVSGLEHRATYKEARQTRIDTTALKKELPDVAAYTVTSVIKRFTFN